MTALEQDIRHRIATEGPLTIADYMVLCLTHPQHGYYTTGLPLGGTSPKQDTNGDFITAPEISQMFGELVGVWCMQTWQAMGCPDAFNLVEIGPGRGTLMKDLLRASSAMPDFQQAMHLHLIEISPTLIDQQKQTLPSDHSATWLKDIDELPQRASIIVANELLDALPFRQWCRWEDRWHERAIGVVDDALQFVLRPNRLQEEALPVDHGAQPQGMLFETAPAREAFISRLADLLKRLNGAALLIDYGHLKSGFGDSFQAVRNHAYADPLEGAGQTDLTSHVDFSPLIAAARAAGCTVPTPTTQGQFLLAMGLLERAGSLGHNQSAARQQVLSEAVQRLAGPEQMGDLFKVMALGSPAPLMEQLPGFSDRSG